MNPLSLDQLFVAALREATDDVLCSPLLLTHSPGSSTPSYRGMLHNGAAATLSFEVLEPSYLSATLTVRPGDPRETETSVLLHPFLDFQEVAEEFASFLNWCTDPIKELRRRLLQEAPSHWTATLSGYNRLSIGPAGESPAPYTVHLEPGDLPRVVLAFWSDPGPSPCDCCDDTPGYDLLFERTVRDGFDFEEVIGDLADYML